MRLVILGEPGAGKGTQAVHLAQHFKIEHISSGDMLREQIKQRTKLGVEIEELLKQGQLVPDHTIISLIRTRITRAENGYILDGFPRTLNQAVAMDTFVKDIDRVIKVSVADEIIVERMSGRIICKDCGTTYHKLYHPSKTNNICDLCGGGLMQRDDDKAKTVLERLRIYHELTEPIEEYYRKENILLNVSGIGDVKEIFKTIIEGLRLREDVAFNGNTHKE